MDETAPREKPSGGTLPRLSSRLLFCLLGLSLAIVTILFCVISLAFSHAVHIAAHLPWFVGLSLLGKIPPALLWVFFVAMFCAGAALCLYILARI